MPGRSALDKARPHVQIASIARLRGRDASMHYKLYSYELTDERGRAPLADTTHKIFDDAKARDTSGEYTEYRGRKDAVLMHVRNYEHNFIGAVGRHAIEREVTSYDERHNEVNFLVTDDDDYPNTPFI